MGEIGEYIHLKLKNYQTYSLNRYGGTKESPNQYANQLQVVRDGIKARAKAKAATVSLDVETLKNNIATILEPDTETGSNLNKYQQIVIQQMVDKYKDALQQLNLPYGKAERSQEFINTINTARKNTQEIFKKANSDQQNCLLSLEKKINELQTLINTFFPPNTDALIKTNARLLNDVKKIQEQYNNIRTAYESGQSLLGITKEGVNAITDGSANTFLADIWGTKKMARPWSLEQNVNQMYTALFNAVPINNETGDFAEYTLGLAWAMGLGIGDDQLKNVMEKSVKGEVRTSKNIKLDYFNDDIQKALQQELNNNKWAYQFNNGEKVMIAPNATQQKVDIVFELPNTSDSKKHSLNVSAKNYNFKSHRQLSIVSGSPLLVLIQNEDSTFVNHYLNLTAAHGEDSIDSAGLGALRHQVQDTMQVALIYKALSGDVSQEQPSDFNPVADTFIVMDNSRTGADSIYIFSISDMIEHIADDIQHIDNYASITGNSKSFKSIVNFKNDRAETSAQRIANLLMDVLNCKIHVSLKVSAIKSKF